MDESQSLYQVQSTRMGESSNSVTGKSRKSQKCEKSGTSAFSAQSFSESAQKIYIRDEDQKNVAATENNQ